MESNEPGDRQMLVELSAFDGIAGGTRGWCKNDDRAISFILQSINMTTPPCLSIVHWKRVIFKVYVNLPEGQRATGINKQWYDMIVEC